MIRARIGGVAIALGLLAVAGPCYSQWHQPERHVPRSEVIALCEVERGNVTPETIANAPANAAAAFDIRAWPTVSLKVKHPLKGCRAGDVYETMAPAQSVAMPDGRGAASRPVLLHDGDEVLAYLSNFQGKYAFAGFAMVEDGKLEIRVEERWVDDHGNMQADTRTEQVPVADALRMIEGCVRRWNEAQAYDTTRQGSAQLIDDYGQNKWLDPRILEELVRRQDGTALGTIAQKADDLAKLDIAKALSGVPGAEPVPYLIGLLSCRYDLARFPAIEGLARPEAKAAVPKLTQLLTQKDGGMPIWRSIGPIARAMVAIGDAQGVEEVLKAAVDPRAAYAMPEVIDAIAGWPGPAAEAFLLAHLRDFAIEARPQSDAIPKQREANRAAAKALARRGNEAGIQRLLEMLEEDRAKGLSMLTVNVLAELGGKRAMQALLGLLQQEDQRRQDWEYAEIARALVRIGDEEAVQPLIEFVDRSQKGRRDALIRAVGEWDHPAVTAMLVRELNGDDAWRMCAAALVLHKRGVKQGADRVLQALNDSLTKECPHCAYDERHCMYSALAEMKEPRAIPLLITAMAKEPAGWHRGAAHSAIKKITGVELPADAELWQKWWDERKKER